MILKAYVDGSFNQRTNTYGSGVVIIAPNGDVHEMSFSGDIPEFAKQRNVAGELAATVAALQVAEKTPNVTELHIYYDYMGIELWATGKWRAKNQYTQAYVSVTKHLPFKLFFHKVAAHTGDTYNELADSLAKKGAGI